MFSQGFLHIDEYPPDANQGFDIPSAVVSFPDFQASMHFLEDHSLNKSPVISKLQVLKLTFFNCSRVPCFILLFLSYSPSEINAGKKHYSVLHRSTACPFDNS